MKKKILITLIAICTMLFAFGMMNASAETATGSCGNNVTWEYDDTTLVLTISGRGAMNNYTSNMDSPWYKYKSTIKTIMINEGVTSIGNEAFSQCSNLTQVALPESLITIGSGAFYNCNKLPSISIPDGVTEIGNTAFVYDSSLSEISLPEHAMKLGKGPFYGCGYYNDTTNWEGDALYIGAHLIEVKSTFSGKYTIKDGTKSICGKAFTHCKSLTEVYIPKDVKIIGNSAFYLCTSLKKVSYGGTNSDWDSIEIEEYGNDYLFNAREEDKVEEEYRINSITIKDMSGNSLQTIPTGHFLATVSFTNVSSSEDTVIVLAQYTDAGAFKGLMYIQTEDVPTGSTIKLSIPVDNSKGDVAELKAFCWESFGSLTPMGNSASFPAE